MTGIPLTDESLRIEMARHRVSRIALGAVIGMNPNQVSMYVTGFRTITPWARQNLGWGVNILTGLDVFDVDMDQRLVAPGRNKDLSTSQAT